MREASPQKKKAPLVYTNGAFVNIRELFSNEGVLVNKTRYRHDHRHYLCGYTQN
jgi:hypothetical protein